MARIRSFRGDPVAGNEPSGNSGFTLVEILVSLAIVGGLFATLLVTLNHHLDVVGGLERRLGLQNAAERMLEELQAEDGLQEGERSGTVQPEGFTYQLSVKPAGGVVAGIGLRWVHLSVANEGGEDYALDLWVTP